MVLPLVVVLAASAATPVKLAAPPWRAVGVDAAKATFFSDFFAQQLQQQSDLQITTSSEIKQLVGMERENELTACSDAAPSCTAELASALGVDGLITGTVAKTERSYVVTIKVIRIRDAAPMGLASGKAADEDALVDWLTSVAPQVAASVKKAMGRGRVAPR